jgi:hypothetical protein
VAAEAVDEKFAGKALAIAVSGLKGGGAVTKVGQPGIDAAFLHQVGIRKLREQDRNMLPKQFFRRVSKQLCASVVAFADYAQVIECEYHEIERCNIGNSG